MKTSTNDRDLIKKVQNGATTTSFLYLLYKLDLPHDTPVPKKRFRVDEEEIEERSPFITTMQDDLEDEQLQTQQIQEQHSPISIPDSEICMFVSECHSEQCDMNYLIFTLGQLYRQRLYTDD